MDDRELLELAAKAAGISVSDVPPWSGYNDREGFYTMNMDGSAVTSRWNPLEDDGDALRLAVKLRIGFTIDESENRVHGWCKQFSGTVKSLGTGDLAVRRAIVYAAAEIGKTK